MTLRYPSYTQDRVQAGLGLEKHIEVLRERRRVRLTSELYKNDPFYMRFFPDL